MMTKSNILDNIRSIGEKMNRDADPSSYSFERRDRAEGFVAKVEACRAAWIRVQRGDDPLHVLRWLDKKLIFENSVGLVVAAVEGRFEHPISELKAGFHWITFEGDLYGVDMGNRLNVPSVFRVANRNLPRTAAKVTEGSQKIAAMIPNPCTRITAPVAFA